MKVDFYHNNISNRDSWVGITIENTTHKDNYVSLSAGCESNAQYYYYETGLDGMTMFGDTPRGSDNGVLYISYDASVDKLYLSFTGYGSENAWQTMSGLLQGSQWASEPVDVTIGGGSDSVALTAGEAYLDNFEINDGLLLGWPPATDLDGDGYTGLGDVARLCEDWLQSDPNVAALLSSFVGHWKMNDNEPNTVVVDSSGNGNHGTAQQNTEDLYTTGKINGALTFDGTSDYVDVGYPIGDGAYTKAAWVNRQGGVQNNIISADTWSHVLWAPSAYSFKLSAGHNYNQPGGGHDLVQDSEPLEVGAWHFVAVTFDPNVESGKMVLYKDGAAVDEANNVPTQLPGKTYIGQFLTNYNFEGSIDNVMIFDRALTAEEIETLYNEGNGTETFTDLDIESDINNDDIVNFLDLAKIGLAW
ncbi:MAG: LamG domain-containing protein [Planctomycetota bacterium]|jgi:hypothetical protein